jgi:hypothetical protein
MRVFTIYLPKGKRVKNKKKILKILQTIIRKCERLVDICICELGQVPSILWLCCVCNFVGKAFNLKH